MADAGKIALSLELSLSAGPAMKSVEELEDKFMKIEKSVENIGKLFSDMPGLKVLAAALDDIIKKVGDVTAELGKTEKSARKAASGGGGGGGGGSGERAVEKAGAVEKKKS